MARPYTEEERKNLQKLFLEDFEKTGGFVHYTCNIIGICHTTYYGWYNNDEEFRQKIIDIKELCIDKAEVELYSRALHIKERDTPLMAYLNAKGRKRGYGNQPSMEDTHEPYKLNETDEDLIKRIKESAVQEYLALKDTNVQSQTI